MPQKRIALLFYVWICLLFSSCYAFRAYKSRRFELNDLPKLQARTIVKSNAPFYFQSDLNNSRYQSIKTLLDTNLENSQTHSFMVIKNDTIIYEKYFNGLVSSDLFPSFSVAKSFVGTLVQIAHEEGYIKSLSEPVTNYLPYLLKNDERFRRITIQHLLDMRSGIKSNENYSNPFSDVLKLGFTKNIQKRLKKLQVETSPGTFNYISVNTQLLGLVVQQASGKKLYHYLQEKLWQPLGMEADASWNTDSRKQDNVRAFCCLNAITKDFAKLGRLYLQKGNWNGIQLLHSSWIHATTSSDSMYKYEGYRNQWWGAKDYKTFDDSLLATEYAMQNKLRSNVHSYTDKLTKKRKYFISYTTSEYMAQGMLGQYVYVNPESKVIIVRTGHYWNAKYLSGTQLIYTVGRRLADN